METQKRDKTIDIAKGIGMMLVVFGHTQFQYIQFVYQFHLPLFFFLSGLVFNEKKVDDYFKFALNKIKSLWIPFIKYEIFFLILHNFFSSIGFYSSVSNYKLVYSLTDVFKRFGLILTMGYGEKLAGPLWFLISSLEIVLFFGLLELIFRKLKIGFFKQNLLISLIALLCFIIGCHTHFPRMGSQSLIGLFFFSAGFLFKNVKESIPYKWYFALFCLGLVLICYKFNFVDISMLSITYKPLLILSGLSGCYLVLYVAKRLPQVVTRPIEYCGRHTISVLALHCLSFKIVLFLEILICGLDKNFLGYFPTYDINVWWTALFTFFGITVPLLISWGVDNIKEKIKGAYETKIN